MTVGFDKILTISFDTGDNVTLQYHPSSVVMDERNYVSNRPGLDSTITFVPAPNTFENSIKISTCLTAIVPKKDEFSVVEQATSALVSSVFTGLSTSAEVMDYVEGLYGGVSLAKGWYDILSGRITTRSLNPSPRGLSYDHFNKLIILDDALHHARPCTIIWDLDNNLHAEQKYVISVINTSVESIREEDGASLIIKLDITLNKQGARVSVI